MDKKNRYGFLVCDDGDRPGGDPEGAARKIAAVNLAVEQNAWGAFRTEFYPAYDFKPIWESTDKK